MKFDKLIVYDFKDSTNLRNNLKPFCNKMIFLSAGKDFCSQIKPEDLVDADALVAKPFENYNKEFFLKANKLKYFGLVSTGFDVVDVNFLRSKKVTFTNIPHYATESVAELTFSALLEIARKTGEKAAQVKETRLISGHVGWALQGKTLGVIGLGSIGIRVAEIAKAFGMSVTYYSRKKKPDIEKKIGIKYLELNELLKIADIITLHCALNKETEKILNKENLKLLKEGAVVLNSARAALCDLDAVKELAQKGKISFWIDDLDSEEQRKKLIGVQNVLATPHMGWMTNEAKKRLDEIAVENVKNFLEGKPVNVVK